MQGGTAALPIGAMCPTVLVVWWCGVVWCGVVWWCGGVVVWCGVVWWCGVSSQSVEGVVVASQTEACSNSIICITATVLDLPAATFLDSPCLDLTAPGYLTILT